MTNERMALLEPIEQRADGNLVREMLAYAAERIMEMEVELKTGVAKGSRSPLREVQRKGYRERDSDTRAVPTDMKPGPKILRLKCRKSSKRPHSHI